jgi:Uma2 family endonuclease
MTIATIASPIQTDLKFAQSASPKISLEEFIKNPPKNAEWVNAQIIEKQSMGFLHSRVQVQLAILLSAFLDANKLGGSVCSELLCRTLKQARKPDVAYMSAKQVQDYGSTDFTTLPECFPLVIEIASPSDIVEDIFSKAEEYLEAGALEVWLVFPKNRLIIIATLEMVEQVSEVKWNLFANNHQATSPKVLSGFSVNINELLPTYVSKS